MGYRGPERLSDDERGEAQRARVAPFSWEWVTRSVATHPSYPAGAPYIRRGDAIWVPQGYGPFAPQGTPSSFTELARAFVRQEHTPDEPLRVELLFSQLLQQNPFVDMGKIVLRRIGDTYVVTVREAYDDEGLSTLNPIPQEARRRTVSAATAALAQAPRNLNFEVRLGDDEEYTLGKP